ncbi:MAG: hypothetical protein WKF30_00540, partial [Pyrinomonadaceae bacterium]
CLTVNFSNSFLGGIMVSRNLWHRLTASCLVLAVVSTYSMVGLAAPEQKLNKKAMGELNASGQVLIDGSKAISGNTLFSDSTLETGENSGAVVSLGKLGRVEYLPNSSSKLSFADAVVSGSLEEGSVRVSKPAGVSTTFTTNEGTVVAIADAAAVFSLHVKDGHTVVAAESGRVELRGGDGESTAVGAGETGIIAQQTQGQTQTQTQGQTQTQTQDQTQTPGQTPTTQGQQPATQQPATQQTATQQTATQQTATQQTATPPQSGGEDLGRGATSGIVVLTATVLAAIIYGVTRDDDNNTQPGPVVISVSPTV